GGLNTVRGFDLVDAGIHLTDVLLEHHDVSVRDDLCIRVADDRSEPGEIGRWWCRRPGVFPDAVRHEQSECEGCEGCEAEPKQRTFHVALLVWGRGGGVNREQRVVR